jgi:hypothetical protein
MRRRRRQRRGSTWTTATCRQTGPGSRWRTAKCITSCPTAGREWAVAAAVPIPSRCCRKPRDRATALISSPSPCRQWEDPRDDWDTYWRFFLNL